MLQKIKDSIRNKHFAVFFDEKGKQKEVKKISVFKDMFKHNKGAYFKSLKKYNHLSLNHGFKNFVYFFYNYKFAEPLEITGNFLTRTKQGEPFIAEHIQLIFEGKVLSEVNRKKNDLFENLDMKKIIIIGAVLFIGYYLLSGGTLT